MKILVIGATGLAGSPVAKYLSTEGHQVRVMSRDLETVRSRFDSSFEIVRGDVEDITSLTTATQDCEGVHINLDGKSDPDLERRGVENIVRVAKENEVKMLSYLSGATVTEENGWYPGTKAKLQAEAAIRSSGLAYVIFRSTFFMETLPRFVNNGRASIIGTQPNLWRWVAVEDYARMVAKAYTIPNLKREFYIYGPQALTMKNALQQHCNVVHSGMKVNSLPFWVAGMIAALSKDAGLQSAISFFRYTEKTTEVGSADEANSLLGKPATTLIEWAKNQASKQARKGSQEAHSEQKT